MTVPVLTTTVPGAGPLQSQGYYVSLYLPVKFQGNPPLPLPELNIRPYEFTTHCVAVRKFSGFANDERIVKEAEKLATSLSRSPWAQSKTRRGYSIAQYNTPIRIVNRKNEVWVDIDAPQSGCESVGVSAYWWKEYGRMVWDLWRCCLPASCTGLSDVWYMFILFNCHET